MEFMFLVIVAVMAGVGWNYFVTQRFEDRFAPAFIEELKSSYPQFAEHLTAGLGAQVAHVVLNNKKLLKSIETAQKRVFLRPEISGNEYRRFDSDYSDKTQRLIIEVDKREIDFATKVYNCLSYDTQFGIMQKEMDIDDRIKDAGLKEVAENILTYFDMPPWKFRMLKKLNEIVHRAAAVAG